MKFCNRCNTETNRYKSGKCMPCVKIFNAAIYAANPAKNRARAKAWNMENKGKVKERDAKRYYSNPEHARARAAKWKALNPNVVAEYNKAYYALNEARIVAYRAGRHSANRDAANSQSKEWRKANTEKMRALKANYRFRKLCNGGVHTAADIVELLTLQKGLCICCRADLNDGYHVDHRMPLKLEGGNDKYNIQLLCPTCNLSKGSKDPIKFMQSRGFLL